MNKLVKVHLPCLSFFFSEQIHLLWSSALHLVPFFVVVVVNAVVAWQAGSGYTVRLEWKRAHIRCIAL